MDWTPHPSLDPSLIPTIRSAIDCIPSDHLQPPASKEIFDNPDAAYERLQNWAFSQGFCIVIASHIKNVMMWFVCKHHRDKTHNICKLDDKAGDDSNRTREFTHISAKGCSWKWYVSWKDRVQGKGDKAWILGTTVDHHNHDMIPNLLSYDIHRKRQPDHAKAIGLAMVHREAVLSYH